MEPLVIVGASARAAAQSALRSGFQPLCADMFADTDLAARCPVRGVETYPDGLADAVEAYPAAPWLYTGGLENHPALVDRMAACRPLLGNPGQVLRRVRDPRQICVALQDLACRFPEWRPTADGLPRDGSWLRKGYASAGGLQVESWTTHTRAAAAAKHYFQRRIDGQPIAALYVAAGGRSVLLGATHQLLTKRCREPFSDTSQTENRRGLAHFAVPWEQNGPVPLSADGSRIDIKVPDTFCARYAGSMGPLAMPQESRAALIELGDRLASTFQLVGIFGVDCLLAADGVYAVDINPRYPASAEVLERAGGFSAIGLHVEACGSGTLPAPPSFQQGYFGKAILFARRECVAHAAFARSAQTARDRGPWPEIADVPAEGSPVAAGWPVMTVFAQAESLAAVQQQLDASLEHWRQLIGA
jgi:predicted ATP-grasp superfamily ATP-dependent carboligase